MLSHNILSIAGADRTEELMHVARGEKKSDIAILNASIVNVYSGELLHRWSVTIKGEWIAYVGKEPGHTIGPHTKIIDADGKTLIPGLIDGHTHLAWLLSPYEFLKHGMIGGTTTIITETMEVFPVSGYNGVIDFLNALNDQPIKIFATAPFMASISKRARGIPLGVLKNLLLRDDIVGLGESYWQTVLQEPEKNLAILQEAANTGKTLEGHSAGAKAEKLMSYVIPGISSCHEPINQEEALERLRLGMYVMIREGSIRSDLDAICSIKDSGIDFRRLILVTDGIEPKDLIYKGYMETLVQKAIDCGFDPIHAIQMSTINVAEHFALDSIVGGIAPGKYADILIIPDSKTIKAEQVISKGKIIASNGRLIAVPRKHTFSIESRNSVDLPTSLMPPDFSITIKTDLPYVHVRIIDQVTPLVTKEIIKSMPVINGEIRLDTDHDILKVAAIDRRFIPGKMFVGLIRGFHLSTGAIACSAAWDTSDIIVVGENERDMSEATNRIHEIQGGAVVYANGKILEEIPLPIFGVMADISLEKIAKKMDNIKNITKALGCPFENPLLTLVTLTGAAIPFLRICEEGLVNLRDGKHLDLIVQ
jgi:adenine deaminase